MMSELLLSRTNRRWLITMLNSFLWLPKIYTLHVNRCLLLSLEEFTASYERLET